MALVSFDDQYPIHRKVAGLSDAAFRLHTSAIFWSHRNGTRGFIPSGDISLVCPEVRGAKQAAAECVRQECWREVRDGWVINDYGQRQGDPMPRGVRAFILERDGYRCQGCGWAPGDPVPVKRRTGRPVFRRLEVDHIWPKSRGGSGDPANLQTLCTTCNASKGARI